MLLLAMILGPLALLGLLNLFKSREEYWDDYLRFVVNALRSVVLRNRLRTGIRQP